MMTGGGGGGGGIGEHDKYDEYYDEHELEQTYGYFVPPRCLTFLHPDAFYAFMCVHCVCKLCFCTYFSIVMYYTVLFYSIRCVPFSSIVLQVESRGDRKLKSMKYIYQKWMV